MSSLWPHRFSLLLSIATLILIFVGGLVTSTDSGLAVPDWPLSYGQLMPPMVGGIFYEHGHRMVAAAVGFLTVLLAIFFSVKKVDRWLQRMAWIAVGLVILQGVLGGLTVLFRLPRPISILHACLAQTFFCLVVALTVWTSLFWKKESPRVKESKGDTALHKIAFGLFVISFFQLIFGAVLRHSGWGFTVHVANAFVVMALSAWIMIRFRKQTDNFSRLKALSFVTFFMVIFQMGLGLTTYFLMGYDFPVIPTPFSAILTITSHVGVGALILGLTVVLALATHRLKPPQTSSAPKTKISDYFELTKPGITLTAGITALAGFVLGSRGDIDFIRLMHTSLGTLFIAAGAGTLNMLIEKDVDARMKRTQKRPLPSGRMKPGEALFLGTFLSVVAILYLSWAVNFLTAFIAGLTLSVYLYVYTPLKKITAFCTTIGAIAGALPPVMGWTAATGRLGLEALVLFGILFFWQFPHFLSLAWLYKDDYLQAGLHMLPRVEDNGATTGTSIFLNSVALLIVSVLPTLMGLTGYFYLGTALLLGFWITGSSFLFLMNRSKTQARKLFFASLAYVPILVVSMVIKI